MLRATAILLMFLMGSPIFLKTGVLLWYAWNQPEIAATQCINRNRPEMKCHGKCVLAKHLKKVNGTTDEQTPKLPANLLEKAETTPFLPTKLVGIVFGTPTSMEYTPAAFSVNCPPDQGALQQIFKPPKV